MRRMDRDRTGSLLEARWLVVGSPKAGLLASARAVVDMSGRGRPGIGSEDNTRSDGLSQGATEVREYSARQNR